MERSCPLGIVRFVPQENFSLFGVLSHIINPLSLFGQDDRWKLVDLVSFVYVLLIQLFFPQMYQHSLKKGLNEEV